MKNGSIEFVAVMAEKFKVYVEPYVYYELKKDFEDLGFPIREISKRILELCKNKDFLKKERSKARKLRSKIVGVGNTSDSYGNKYLQGEAKKDKKEGFSNTFFKKDKTENDNKFNSIGSYDPYKSNKTL